MIRAAFAILIAAIVVAAPLRAQPSYCSARDQMVEWLSDRYGESRQAIGLDANNRMLEVFASTKIGTWTITLTTPNGVTCVVGSGQSFELTREPSPKKEDQL